jgi:molybdate transport system substrate-binding protein
VNRLRRFIALPLLLTLLLACTPGQATPPGATTPTTGAATAERTTATGRRVEVTVFAAASLTDAFQVIGKNFEETTPGTRVTFNFAGSQQLAQQIVQGAPADVFASADAKQMNVVVKAGETVGEAPRIFAHNRLVVIYPASNPAKLSRLQDLAKPGVKIILADKAVPVGRYALDFLDKASKDSAFGPTYKDAVLKNVVSYEQDVKAVLSKVELGEADAGIVYTTDAALDTGKVDQIAIPDQLNTIASYPIVAIKASKHVALAEKLVAYILSPDGQAVLAKYGFIPGAESPVATSSADESPRATFSTDLRRAWIQNDDRTEVQ